MINIKIKENKSDVKFLSKQSLSQGKQTAFILSLVASLQKLEMCPLLLFDEVGQNLDHRNMEVYIQVLSELSKHTQIILTSFSDQILDLDNINIMKIEMQNESKITPIDKDEAHHIIRSV